MKLVLCKFPIAVVFSSVGRVPSFRHSHPRFPRQKVQRELDEEGREKEAWT